MGVNEIQGSFWGEVAYMLLLGGGVIGAGYDKAHKLVFNILFVLSQSARCI